MKKYINIIIFTLATLSFGAAAQTPVQEQTQPSAQSTTATNTTLASDPQTKWAMANAHYQKGEYAEAIVIYEELLGGDEHSEALYYNLANAYFKNNNLGKAILNFNRALLLNPGNEDTQHNLAVANARTIDKIEPVPQFFVKKWFVDLGSAIGSDAWAIWALIFFALTLAGVVVWLISSTLLLRKVGFYTALLSIVLTIASFAYAQTAYGKLASSKQAIVTNSAAPIKSAPDASGKDIFLLHEGTRVAIVSTQADWSQIILDDGNKGWVQSNSIEKIQSR